MFELYHTIKDKVILSNLTKRQAEIVRMFQWDLAYIIIRPMK